jgi:rhodanese-related sulfurtransferase
VVTAIDRSELLRLVETEDAQLVDVLSEREYTEAHIPDAISIPLRQLTSDTASVLSRDKPVAVY